ncbi:MAG: helix-turn-helix domain-containing protein [Flavobacteriaceae bacterium]|nr:helix-turn-helix domain-containing protein [Flavobacteriaceae bacterium]MDA9316953.1 helix-turn-helix domain-containing protein [Polaribacter sp.]MDB9993431.1 helix-turn-helix domain-containing protein [Flavobacteriaceae bacterium]
MNRQLMTIGEAATYLGISVSHLYKMCSIRSIDFYKIGRSNKFLIADLNEFISKNKISKKKESMVKLKLSIKI